MADNQKPQAITSMQESLTSHHLERAMMTSECQRSLTSAAIAQRLDALPQLQTQVQSPQPTAPAQAPTPDQK